MSSLTDLLSDQRGAETELFWGTTVERRGLGKLWKDEISSGDVYVLHSPVLVQSLEAAAASGERWLHPPYPSGARGFFRRLVPGTPRLSKYWLPAREKQCEKIKFYNSRS